MRCALPILVAACLLGAGVAGPGCQPGEPGSCGRAVEGGQFRFCSDDPEDSQICICSTGRCAKSDSDCDFGMRYVYGDDECVPQEDVMRGGFVLSGGPTAACFDVPTARPAIPYGSERRVDPRLLRFGDRVLLETVDPYPLGAAPVVTTDPARVFVNMLSWEGQPEGAPVSVDLEATGASELAVHGAESWGACDAGDPGPRSALFAHLVAQADGGERPALFRAWLDGTRLRLDDVTASVFGTDLPAAGLVQALRVVGTPDGCWIAWIEDPDGPAGGGALYVQGRRLRPDGAVDPAVTLMSETDDAERISFSITPARPGEESPPLVGLMAADDGEGGLVVGVPIRRPDDGVALWSKRLARGSALPIPIGVAVTVAAFGSSSSECGPGACRGIEFPELNPVAAREDRIYFAYVLVGADGSPPYNARRKLFVSAMLRDLSAPGAPAPVGELASPLRLPTLVSRPDGGVFGAVMGWDGNDTPTSVLVHQFHIDGASAQVVRSLPNPLAFLPRLAVDDGGFLVTQFLTVESGGGFGLRLVRSQPEGLEPAPTWPADGVPLQPDGALVGGDPSNSVSPPVSRPDGGVLVAWTTPDLHVVSAWIEAVL